MKISDKERVKKIVNTWAALKKQIEEHHITRELLLNDEFSQWAATTPLYNIGEQVYMLSTDFKKEHSDIPWSVVSGLRHRLVHDYEGINWSFLQAGCIDELSLIIAPATDGQRDTATTFDRSSFMADGVPVGFTLKEAKRVQSDGVWLTYEPNNIKR